MIEYLPLIGTVSLVHLLGVMSPGPDFIVCVRSALIYSRRTGIYTAIGFGLGVAVHIFYCLAGLATIISQSILLFNTIKFLGAGYLIYIGLLSFFSRSSKILIQAEAPKDDISRFSAIKIGFLTNALNPKASLFFLSLFTLVITPNTPLSILTILSTIMIGQTILWFSFVALFLSQERIRSVFERSQAILNKTVGGLLVALGVKVALTEK
jgi:RhtB (resistance to homoserine/threonine) family protein